jgi:hypothetical protein
MAKRAREFAVKERRDLKRAKKAEAAARRAAPVDPAREEIAGPDDAATTEGEPLA